MRTVMIGAAAALGLWMASLGGCAAGPGDEPQASRGEGSYVTGSNIPRRPRVENKGVVVTDKSAQPQQTGDAQPAR